MFARCVQWSLRPEGGIRCPGGGVKGRCVCPEVVVQRSTQVLLQEQWALLTAELSLQSHKTCLWKLYDIRNLSEHAETEDQWHCRSLRYLPAGLSSSRSPHWGGAVHWDVSVRQSFRTRWDVLTREKTLLTPKKIEKNWGWGFILPQAQPKKLHFVVLWKADLEQSQCPFSPPFSVQVPISKNNLLEKRPRELEKVCSKSSWFTFPVLGTKSLTETTEGRDIYCSS